MRNVAPKSGFTLVELLTVMVVLSIMGSMVLVALSSASRSAKEARTRAIVTAIDTVLQEKYEAFKHRPLPITIPDLTRTVEVPPNSGNFVVINHEVAATEAARVRLMMRRDLQRMEMPDKIRDVVSTTGAIVGPMSFSAVAHRIAEDTSGQVIRRFNDHANDPRIQFSVIPNISHRLQVYFNRYLTSVRPGAGGVWTTQNESSECLYLIMATSQYAGLPALDSIPRNSIGDTDGDGMLEILDAWGTPIGFVRWPVGYSDPSGTLSTANPDDFDPFRVDFGYLDTSLTYTTPYSMRPLVVSAGADEEFGVVSSNGFDYTAQTWPLGEMGAPNNVQVDESEGRSGLYSYPDPYLRHATAAVLPGGTPVGGAAGAVDDVTNYTIKVSQ